MVNGLALEPAALLPGGFAKERANQISGADEQSAYSIICWWQQQERSQV